MPRILPRLVAITAALFATPAAAAHGAVILDGGGFGHGAGMSQYGAYGFALKEGRPADWIVTHYYQGSTAGPPATNVPRMRVLIRDNYKQVVCDATRARDRKNRRIVLQEDRSYRFLPAGVAGVRMEDVTSGRVRSLRAPVRVTGGSRVCLRGKGINGVNGGSYRGRIVIDRDDDGTLLAVNDVAMRHYLFGVVPAEMPTSWPIEAVKAQAIVARSYAMRETRPNKQWDVWPDVRSQVYKGFKGETDNGQAAVLATGNTVVRVGDLTAKAVFSSSSGGITANNEEVFGNVAPLGYLRSVTDPYDNISPYHEWTAQIPDAEAQQRLGDAVRGNLLGVKVSRRGPSGRVLSLDVIGTEGTTTISGPTAAARLQLRSSYFSVRA